MINNDPTDKVYAIELRDFIEGISGSSPEEIYQRSYAIAEMHDLNHSRPKNLMLQIVEAGIMFDELDPACAEDDQAVVLEKYKKILNDYLSGNYYPAHFILSGTYAKPGLGYSWHAQVKSGRIVVEYPAASMLDGLQVLADEVRTTGDDEKDLTKFLKRVPERIDALSLTSSMVDEYLY